MQVGLLTIHIYARLAKLQGALDAIEAVKTGVEQNSRTAETAAVQLFSSIRAAVNSREKAVLKVPNNVELTSTRPRVGLLQF